ncbi:S1 RNA-binding domain-containing protein [Spirillospora sp. NPDC127200]
MGDETENSDRRDRLETLRAEVGYVRRGTVRSIESYGVVVDLGGGLTGTVNYAELTWQTVGHASEVVEVGQEVVVQVLEVDPERERVALSTKALQDDPFKAFARASAERTVTGRVTKTVPFGVFVRVHDGVEGLLHDSELDGRAFADGDEITVRVAEIDLANHRVSLSL